jgi:hypothetical protein
MFMGVISAVLLHGIYDFFLFMNDIPALAVVAFASLGGGVALSFISMNKSAKMSPFKNKQTEATAAEHEEPTSLPN